MLLLVAVAFATGTGFADLAGVTPVEKVLTLLGDLQNQVKEEGSAEVEAYDKFACFCKDKETEKMDTISTAETEIETMTADLMELESKKAQLSATIQELTEKIGEAEAALKEMTEIREKERAIFEAAFADATAALDALVKAIAHLEDAKGAKLVEVKHEVQKTLDLASTAGFAVKNHKAVTAFLQQLPEGQGEYEFKSGGIIDTLKDLEVKFQARKDELDATETEAQSAFETAAGGKRDEIDAAKTELDTATADLSETESSIAETSEMVAESKAQLNDDNLYLKDMTGQCERKAKEWDQRSKARSGELAAISKALEIIGGTVAEKAESTGSGGRSTPAAAEAPAEAAPAKLVQVLKNSGKLLEVKKADPAPSRPVSFTQVQTVENKPEAIRSKVLAMLSEKAREQKSVVLSALLIQLHADPFAKVKVLIQQLIQRLLAEAANEATHKGWCDTEMGKAKKDREFRHGDTVKLNAHIAEQEALVVKLNATAFTLTKELGELNDSLVEATTNRDQDKANNLKTLADAKEGVAALKEAIEVLTNFYKGAATSANKYEGGGYEGAKAALVQASPVDEDMAAGGVAGGELGAYKGNTEAGESILAMLDVIKSDFEHTLKSTEESEYTASREFAAFSQETKASIASKETGLEHTENDLQRTSGDLVNSLNDLDETQKLLDKSLEALEKLRPACVDTGMSYEERVERREAEIEALKNAICVLDEEDGEVPECAGKMFLQRK
jgi:hypothetical protein